MLKRIRLSSIYALLAGTLLLSACGGTAATPTATTITTGGDATATTAMEASPTTAMTDATATTAMSAETATSGTTTSGEAIPIGIAVAQTSNVALLGQEQVIGAKIAEKFFNDKGGVNGTPIKLIFQDTAGDEAGTINACIPRITKTTFIISISS